MSLSRLLRYLAALICVLALAGTGCGIPNDGSPRVIAVDDLPVDLTENAPPTPEPAPDAFSFQIWMIGDDNKLTRVAREITRTPEGVMNSLLLGTETSEREDGIATAITRETGYLDFVAIPEFRRITVNLVDGSLRSASAADQKLAFAQIVYSLTELLEIDEVAFTIGGDPVAVPIDGGASEVGQFLRKEDFASLQRNRPGFAADDEFDVGGAAPAPTPRPATIDIDDTTELVNLSIWMVASNELGNLVRVPRSIGRTPESILVSLFKGPSVTESETNVRTAIPNDAIAPIPDIDETARIAFVDLAVEDLPPVVDDDRMRAIAQIVFSLTELAEIDAVKISIDGERIPLPTASGLSAPDPTLRREDFSMLAPNVLGMGQDTIPDPDSTDDTAVDGETGDDGTGSGGTAEGTGDGSETAPAEEATSDQAPAPTATPAPPQPPPVPPRPTPTPGPTATPAPTATPTVTPTPFPTPGA